jgi:hypothetical protein
LPSDSFKKTSKLMSRVEFLNDWISTPTRGAGLPDALDSPELTIIRELIGAHGPKNNLNRGKYLPIRKTGNSLRGFPKTVARRRNSHGFDQ